jgi:ZipA, C-terminal FtsZ-binding domain
LQANANADFVQEFEDIEVTIPSQNDINAETDDLSVRAFKENADTQSAPSKSLLEIAGMQTVLPSELHPQIDLTAILFANKKISSQSLVGLNTTITDSSLPILMHGLDETDKWHLVSENTGESDYKQAACSIQLADRSGPITKQQLNKFQFAVENMGLALNAHVEWQGTGDAMTHALELDQFCIEVDQLISVHLMQGDSPIHGTKLRGLAEASGLNLKQDGKFHFESNEVVLFNMIEPNNQAFTADSLRNLVLKGVTFQLEISKVHSSEQVFNQMILIAQKMASSLGANLVDDNQKPLGDLQIEKIRQQLKVIHAKMVARGIMPGSPSSMRLFN